VTRILHLPAPGKGFHGLAEGRQDIPLGAALQAGHLFLKRRIGQRLTAQITQSI
jgi:hypothetical protein